MLKRSLQLAPILLAIFTISALNGCKTGGGPAGGLSTKNEVVWHVLSDIERMNPYLSTDESASYVQGEIWEALSGQEPRTFKYIPALAALPEESADHLTWTFSMNQGAKWSDGQPVTGADIIFSYKTVSNPRIINAAAIRGYFNPGLDSVYYPNGDQSKVAFHFAKFKYNTLTIINYVKILPKHIFDPKGLTDKMSWDDLHSPNSTNPALDEFATWFQDEKIGRDPKYLIGSGPYVFKQWITNDRIILQRDTNYWGKDHAWFDAYPDRLIFKTIKDQNATLTALKAKDIDVTEALNASQYLNQVDTVALKGIQKDTVYENIITFLAWNNQRPIFKSKKTRQALTMLINREEIRDKILHGLAKLNDGPIAPTQPNHDPTVKEPAFNLEAGKKLLAEDGWTAGPDGILQKVIDGKMTPFRFSFQVNAGNESRKQILLVVAEGLKKAGIDAGVQAIEWSVYLENTKSHNYDAAYGGWVGNAGTEDDIYQLWHSSQMKSKGSNYYCYSDPEADKLLTDLQNEPDQAKRFEMSRRLQHLMVEDQPVTFMFSVPLFIGWVDRFDNLEFFHTRPPYSPQYWIVRGSGVKRLPTGIPMNYTRGSIPERQQ